jgi:hypothetical protein
MPLPFLGNDTVDTFPWQQIHATIEELLETSFSMQSVSCQRKLGNYFFPELPVEVYFMALSVAGLQTIK